MKALKFINALAAGEALMVGNSKVQPVRSLPDDYLEALISCGLVDDISNPESLQPKPYRYA